MTFLARVNRHMQVLVGVGVAGICSASMYSNTLGLNAYRRFMAQHKDGQEQPLDEATAAMAEKVTIATTLTAEEEASLEFFSVFGQDPCHRGSLKLRTGAYVGLPGTFAYQSTDQVETDKIQIGDKLVDWESDGGQLLLNSIVLSKKAKAFAIAREIAYTNTHHVWIEALYKGGFAFSAYALGFFLNNTFRLKSIMKRWGRGALYSLISGSFFVLYVTMDDTYYCHRDHKVDRKVVQLGREYAEGGLEFYTKLLQRNMALRLLLGEAGSRLYTVYGNDVAKWRRPHAMLTERRDFFVNCLKELDEQSSKARDEEMAA